MHQKKVGRFRQWLSIQIVKNPNQVILLCIILFNLLFFLISALIISHLAPPTLADHGFWASVFYTITMILDAGCISYVVESVGETGVAVIIVCLLIVLIGMITFTGCVIGYITNLISNFIDNSNAGTRKLNISDHVVILNWNNRASEIVNDLLYSEHRERVVIMVSDQKEAVETEIENRLADTINRENQFVLAASSDMKLLQRWAYLRRNLFKNKLTVIVRQGDTFSAKQLMDISLDRAKTVIILNKDSMNLPCHYASEERAQVIRNGNPVTLKTLMLVAEITAEEHSADNQKIIVEVEDNWTAGLVENIITHKEHLGKCNILPISVNRVLGQLLSQFSIMPQLNLVYSELFSNRGAEFYSIPAGDSDITPIRDYISNHYHALPLTAMQTKKSGLQCYFMADLESDLDCTSNIKAEPLPLKLNPNSWQPRRNVLILGHNSKVDWLMKGFQSYWNEWNPARDGRDILNIFVLDDEKSLEEMNFYRDYPYVNVIPTDLHNRDLINQTINSFIDDQDGDTGILILSDDRVPYEDLDSSALTYLIYVQDILRERRLSNNGKDSERIDIIVEILNPKNYDVVHSYSVNNVVISNRYISKMVTQLGEKNALFDFYQDILTYDDADSQTFESKELYIKRVSDIFLEVPGPCTAAQLIRSVFEENKKMDESNIAIILGHLTADDQMTLFSGNQNQIMLNLKPDDKLIIFTNH